MNKTNDKNNDRFIRMTTAPVEKLIWSMALPSIAITMTTSIYNMADTFYVGRLGTSEVAAVGIALPLMTIIQSIGVFFGQGSGIYMSRLLGEQKTEEASRIAATGMVTGFLAMLIMSVVGILNIDYLVLGLGATPSIVPHAKEYILFILIAAPWMAAATILNQQLRLQGGAKMAMMGMVSGNVLHILLSPLFIFVFGLGLKGAAIAAMLSQFTSFLILFVYGSRQQGNIPINFRHFSPSRHSYYEIFRGGVPSLMRQGLMGVTGIIMNNFAGAYGAAAIAAISINNQIMFVANSILLGIGQGFQPVCGFNYGAKLYSRLKKAFWYCVRVSTLGLIVISLVIFIFAPQIVSFFRRDDLEVIAMGTRGLRLLALSKPFIPLVILCTMMTQSVGKALFSSISAMARQGLFLLPSLLIFTRLFDLGLLGIQISLPAADLISFLMVIPMLISVLRKMKEEPETPSHGTA